jgi:hypothetical protein
MGQFGRLKGTTAIIRRHRTTTFALIYNALRITAEQAMLMSAMLDLAAEYATYGYRRLTVMIQWLEARSPLNGRTRPDS